MSDNNTLVITIYIAVQQMIIWSNKNQTKSASHCWIEMQQTFFLTFAINADGFQAANIHDSRKLHVMIIHLEKVG
jgi:hypothetical protein